jgi:anthranilate phosphoribosyltransferase
MRYRQESPEELAGFIAALRESISLPAPRARVDLDWPSYAAGRTRGEPWFLLSALLLAENGIRVLMHAPGRSGSALVEGLRALGLSDDGADVQRSLDEANFAFLPLRVFCAALQRLLDLRRILGLRSAANSVARLINPFGAPCVLQGVFHPAYRELQRSAGALLAERSLAVFKGGGGEAERNPDKPCRVYALNDGAAFDEEWPVLIENEAPLLPQSTQAHPLIACWRGQMPDTARIVIATAAVALRLLGRAGSTVEADELARRMWHARDLARYPRTGAMRARAIAS